MRKDNTADKYYQMAKKLVDKMTVEECMGQLLFNAPEVKRMGIPEYNWWNEGLHGLARSGIATVFPQAVGMAAIFDGDYVKRMAEIVSIEGRAKYNEYIKHGDRGMYKGLTIWSPNINIDRDPRWGRGQETYGEDPYLTTVMGCSYIDGLQGDGETLRAAACAKHMAVHSGPEALRHEFDAKCSPKDMEETYLPAFEAAIKDHTVEGVMGAYNRVNGEAACAHKFFQDKLTEWGFDGYFTSDCWAIRDFHEFHKITETPEDSAALALNNDCDVNCGCTYNDLPKALKKGLITEEQIRKCCVRLMRTRMRLGILGFDEATGKAISSGDERLNCEFDKIGYEVVSCKEHKEFALDCARKSMVLLENNGILPLDENKIKTIAIVGPAADSRTVLEGNYEGHADRYITYMEGLRDRFKGQVLMSEGCHLYKDIDQGIDQDERCSEADIIASKADVVVLCVGLDASIEGEEDANKGFTGDKDGLLLPGSQQRLIERAKKWNKPVILVNSTGSSINPNMKPDAFIQAWYPGSQGGIALAEILFGDVSPSGKLSMTFYKDTEKLPEFTDYSMKGRTYRYTNENILYPFGYGLTYGDVKVTDYLVDGLKATVTATNNGKVDTDDVIQIYMRLDHPDEVPFMKLVGFKRVHVKAGDKVTVEVTLDKNAYTVVNDAGERISPDCEARFKVTTCNTI